MGFASVFARLFNIAASDINLKIIVMCIIVLQVTLNIIGVKITTLINNGAVWTEIIGAVGLAVILFIVAFIHDADPSILLSTGNAAEGTSYIVPFLLTMLMGSYTIVGFEAAANLSEETVNASKTVPKAIISSVVLSGIFGLFFLIAATWAIPNLNDVLNSDNPLPYIIVTNLGGVFGKLFLVIVSISIFACGLVITTSAGRLIYAMSRDNAFIFSQYFKKVSSKTKVPTAALFLILILCLISTYFAESLIDLFSATAVFPSLIYLTTVVAYVLTRKTAKFNSGIFTLVIFSKPVFTFSILL